MFCKSNGVQLKADGLRTAMQRYNLCRGVAKTSIHLYRHKSAVDYLYNGGDIFTLQELLTHSTLEMSKQYADNYCKDLSKNFQETNPLERFAQREEPNTRIHMKK